MEPSFNSLGGAIVMAATHLGFAILGAVVATVRQRGRRQHREGVAASTPPVQKTDVSTGDLARRTLEAVTLRIERQRRMLEATLRYAGVAIWLEDRDGTLQLANPVWGRLTACDPVAAVGRPSATFLDTPELSEAVVASGHAQTGEVRILTGDSGRDFLVTRYPVPSPDGGIDGLGGIATEVTAIRRVEQGLAEANRRLEGMNAYLKKFAEVASHDLRSPLNKARSSLGLLHQRLGESFSPVEERLFGVVQANIDRLSALTDALRELSEVAVQPSRLAWLRVENIMPRVEAALSEEIETSGARISRAADLPSLRADAVLLEQLLVNLISNAIKFARPGQSPVIDIDAPSPEVGVGFVVSDNGVGIRPEDSRRIFEPLIRLQPNIPGRGLGLSLCRRVAEAHNGRIYAEPRPEGGTSFTVVFSTFDAASEEN